MVKFIIKRDGTSVPFNATKIKQAMDKAFLETGEKTRPTSSTQKMSESIRDKIKTETVNIETVQDMVEQSLMRHGYTKTAKAYILYRDRRTKNRDRKSRLMMTLKDMVVQDAKDNDKLRENANVNGNTPMGAMLKIGSETAKTYVNLFQLPQDISDAHVAGDIHIHDEDFYPTGTTTCSQIDLDQLFDHGFNTGHGVIRRPNSIMSYAALTAIIIQANQNDQHGGQSIPNFDRMMVPGIICSFRKNLIDSAKQALIFGSDMRTDLAAEKAAAAIDKLYNSTDGLHLEDTERIVKTLTDTCGLSEATAKRVFELATAATEKQTYQAMESFIHNLNTMNSRAGAQVPFSSINYGTDTSPEARMLVKNLLLATEKGLGHGETPIFPIQIFRCKHGINMAEGEPNYDLFKLAVRVSAKRLFPNFSFQDAPFNLQYYDPENPRTEIAYMGCRTRVIGNVNGPEESYNRGNLSFTSINLPRIGIEANGDWNEFYRLLDERMTLVKKQLLERYAYQCSKTPANFPFLIGQGVWTGGRELKADETLEPVLKQGTLTLGFIGLAECLKAMMGVHHGESDEAQEKGLEIIRHMREFTDAATKETHLNFSLIATPAEGLSGRFVKMDRKKYGNIPGVTDRDYYTNSMHVPVYYPITAFEKIKKEAPYHALTNGGHISYIELDGDPTKNLSAFEAVIKCMDENGIGYGAINHPVDNDPLCGYSGIIGDVCPKCGRKEYHDAQGHYNNIKFDRIRRITGYLVGTLDRFNDGKRAEEADRVKHGV